MKYAFTSILRTAACRLALSVLLVLWAVAAPAQDNAYHAYINRYSDMALEQMYKYGVPASITLAQGLLESGAGRSSLAVRANNHFGIKVGRNWRGPYVLKDDDAPNERFRAYANPAESYEDHSRFLCNNSRYASLFRLERDDYKRWAKGLKAAGYATNPRYAELLINIIERYDLHRYDKIKHKQWERQHMTDQRMTAASRPSNGTERSVYKCNGSFYVLAGRGDTYASVAKWAGISERKLRKYNEVPREAPLAEGDVVYLEKKSSKASRKLKGTVYRVQDGDSFHSIAQSYGMRIETLYKINDLPANARLSVGDVLRIR